MAAEEIEALSAFTEINQFVFSGCNSNPKPARTSLTVRSGAYPDRTPTG